ncbi:hypothetical protein DICPUDRAFT_153984 [Dictyostelium purpureum]|uniref:GSKIP domain-containing protein n=1 Tax=Dictyostelium purpureum TaxID=5786 RepID=F0ZQ92_DICPU|nr:uncharacterized protein DICPUDRAFT_153984 [Dictyostelium purpureum]EGC33904.1 hypothetical protein DICPUDRAFT_153984 [Dictyostelium purpureum]|eukprot:XP_003289587.1 hypothetical protein DICPUDRAFT_153984 [Dictyostelium purpureum]
MESFRDEINDAINDVEYGVNKVEHIEGHTQSEENRAAILRVETYDNIELLVKMCIDTGYSVLEYKNNSDPSLKEDLNKYFDSLSNLLMNYSPEFQKRFGLKLTERLMGLSK